MRAYVTGKVFSTEVGDRPMDDGSFFANVNFIPDGSRQIESAWCSTTSDVFATVEAIGQDGMPHVGLSLYVTPKANRGGGARLSNRLEAIYLLDDQGNPVAETASKKSDKATAAATNGAG